MFNNYFGFYRSLRVSLTRVTNSCCFDLFHRHSTPLIFASLHWSGTSWLFNVSLWYAAELEDSISNSSQVAKHALLNWIQSASELDTKWTGYIVPVNWAAVLVYKAGSVGSRRFYEILWIWETFGRGRRSTTNHDFSRRSQSILKMSQYLHHGKSPLNESLRVLEEGWSWKVRQAWLSGNLVTICVVEICPKFLRLLQWRQLPTHMK